MNPWTIAAISLASFGLGIAFAAWRVRNKEVVVRAADTRKTALQAVQRKAKGR